MLAIETRFLGPTNTRGSRIIASVMDTITAGVPQPRRLIVECEDALGIEANHHAAAVALIRKLEWTEAHGYGPWIIGSSPRGYVYVCDTRHGQDRLAL